MSRSASIRSCQRLIAVFPGCPRGVRLRSGSSLATPFLVCTCLNCGLRERDTQRTLSSCFSGLQYHGRPVEWTARHLVHGVPVVLANVEATGLAEPDSTRSRDASLCQSAEPSLLTGFWLARKCCTLRSNWAGSRARMIRSIVASTTSFVNRPKSERRPIPRSYNPTTRRGVSKACTLITSGHRHCISCVHPV
jgi:hypothetical protein